MTLVIDYKLRLVAGRQGQVEQVGSPSQDEILTYTIFTLGGSSALRHAPQKLSDLEIRTW